MINDPIQPIVLRNLVRLHAYDFLLQFDKDMIPSFSNLFTIWSPSPVFQNDVARHSVHRLCDFLWGYFSQGLDRTKPSISVLDAIYFEDTLPNVDWFDAVSESEPTEMYSAEPRPLRPSEAIARLKEEGFHPGSENGDQVLRSASLAVICRLNLLLSGEPGVGKRRLARLIHRLGVDAGGQLVFISAADLTPETTSRRIRAGGTVVILEIGELSADSQNTLKAVMIDVTDRSLARVISTTSLNLEQLVDTDRFDRDLFHRLSLITVELPPLRLRLSDMGLLSMYFIERFRDSNRDFIGEELSPSALAKLCDHAWPGNLRELQSVVRGALVCCRDKTIEAEHISFSDY